MTHTFAALALGTEKRRTLRLHHAHDDSAAARRASFASSIIDAVVVLVAAGFVQCISIRTVGKRRALVADRRLQDLQQRGVQLLPIAWPQGNAWPGGMNAGKVKYLGSI
jgi:hypothetical protein